MKTLLLPFTLLILAAVNLHQVYAQSTVEAKAASRISASNVTYTNRTSKLKAKNAQAAIDEVNTKAKSALQKATDVSISVAQAIAGSVAAQVSAQSATTTWEGFQYFFAGNVVGSEGPPETLKKRAVTMTFTRTDDQTGTMTITPVNFVCDTQEEFTQNGAGVCGTYGDTFSYDYTLFGANLFVGNGRTSAGNLIGQGVLDGAGAGRHVDIQNQGGSSLVLKYRDMVTSVFDLEKSN